MRHALSPWIGAILAACSGPSGTGAIDAATELGSVISAVRRTDWSGAGAPSIVHRTTPCGATIAPYAGGPEIIQNAIDDCGRAGGGVVELAAGTFDISAGLCLASNVTLRGQGADQTTIVARGSTQRCGLYGSSLAFSGDFPGGFNVQNPPNQVAWTAGYAKGDTVLTLSGTDNLQVGSLLFLDQLDDPDAPIPDGVWNCKNQGVCSHDGAVQFFRPERNMVDVVRVAAIEGNQVTIERGLHMPTWRADRSPGAYWSSGLPIVHAGLEDVTLDTGGSSSSHGIEFSNAYGNWVLRSRIIDGNPTNPKRCVMCAFHGSVRNTTRSNYFYGSRGAVAATGTYGFEMRAACDNLHENNIWEDNTAPFVQGQGAQGNVFAYNYAFSGWYVAGDGAWPTDCYPSGTAGLNCHWMQATARYHAIANNYTLFESNEGTGFNADALRGASVFGTSFRNYWRGWDPQGGAVGEAGKTQQTVPVQLYAWNRFFNFVGNVLGEPGKHSVYECATEGPTGACASVDQIVWALGYSGNQGHRDPINNDVRVKQSLLRWGNYDSVTGTARYEASEVPVADEHYANALPADRNLPESLYLSARPPWYGAELWPAIGPDVKGTLGPGERVSRIPARRCYESMSDDPAYGGNTVVRSFNGASCFGAP